MKTLLRLGAVVIVASLGLAAIGAAVVPQVVKLATANTLEAGDLPPLPVLAQRSIVYDAAGTQIDIFRVENRQPFVLSQVPQPVIDAVLAVEDQGFYQHKGVNAKSLLRAVLANVSAGEVTQGGSTITQQVIKNSLLTATRDANRKILEAAYAVRLEQVMTKDQILERYLNTVYLGYNAYGLQAAAETYFGKNIDQLDIWEGAFLAGLIRNPNGYDPINSPERSRARFRDAVGRLEAVGKVSKADGDNAAANWPLPSAIKSTPDSEPNRTYFTDEVRQQLLNKTNILGDDYQSRYSKLYRGGLKIYTTLNPNLQAAAEQARTEKLPDTAGRFQASLLSMDVKTGAVVAMLGGEGFDKSQVNLALTPRQTGSSAKIFILLAALQAGVQSNDLIDGVLPCTLPNPGDPKDPFVISEGESQPVGPLDRMTWLSINCAYARLSQIVGLNRVVDTAKRLGVQSDIQPIASFATGGNEISALDFATAGATISNLGVRHDPYYVERIEGPDGQVIYQHQDPGTQVVDPGIAERAIDMLKGVITKGTASAEGGLPDKRPAAGKTGTYESNTNATFVGFTAQYSTSVWMGNPLKSGTDPMRGIPEFVKVGVPRVQGGTIPYRIWKAYTTAASQGLPVEDWPAPPELKRKAARLYLPGDECVYSVVTTPAGTVNPTATNADGSPATAPAGSVNAKQVKGGTTIAPTVLDPSAPVPTVPAGAAVYNCKTGPPKPKPPPAPSPSPTTGTTVAGQPGASTPGGSTPAGSQPGGSTPATSDG